MRKQAILVEVKTIAKELAIHFFLLPTGAIA
jgi:hypothetical protein